MNCVRFPFPRAALLSRDVGEILFCQHVCFLQLDTSGTYKSTQLAHDAEYLHVYALFFAGFITFPVFTSGIAPARCRDNTFSSTYIILAVRNFGYFAKNAARDAYH